ncbi:hypothetical protein LDENG_00092060, partial [Lucifuga dentata]
RPVGGVDRGEPGDILGGQLRRGLQVRVHHGPPETETARLVPWHPHLGRLPAGQPAQGELPEGGQGAGGETAADSEQQESVRRREEHQAAGPDAPEPAGLRTTAQRGGPG